MLETEAEVVGYNKKHVWLRYADEEATYRILTMPRDFLPWGMATASRVVVAYDPASLTHDGHGFVIVGEIVRMLDDNQPGIAGSMASESSREEGVEGT